MKARTAILIGLALLLTPLFHLEAQIPGTLSYQAFLSDSLGVPKADGTYIITFGLYGVETGGTALWTETKDDLYVKQGLFYTHLGPFPASLRFDQPYWLGIQVGEELELTPRIPLTSVGYSFMALRSDSAQYALLADSAQFATRADTAKVATSALAAADLADDAVTSAKIQDGTIQRADVATDFIAPFADTSEYALAAPPGGSAGGDLSGTYPDPAIADGSVTPAKIDATDAASGQALMYNGTDVLWLAPPAPIGDGHSLDAADADPIDAVFVDNVGFVGIGTTSPEDVFTISKTLQGPDEPETETLTLIPGSTGRGNPASFVTSFPHVRFITPANISVNGSGVTDVSITTKNTNVLDKLVVGSSGSVSGPVGSASLAGNVSIGGNLTASGGHIMKTVSIANEAYDATTSDRIILGTYDGGDSQTSVTLPAASGATGLVLTIKNIGSGADYFEVAPASGEKLDGYTEGILYLYNLDVVTVVSDGTDWWIISGKQLEF